MRRAKAAPSQQSPDRRGTRPCGGHGCGGDTRGEGISRKRGTLEKISSGGAELLTLEALKKRLDVVLGVLVIADKVAVGHRSDLMILEVF